MSVTCQCGQSFPWTRNGYGAFKEHLQDSTECWHTAGPLPAVEALTRWSRAIVLVGMDLFEEHYGNDRMLPPAEEEE